MRTVRLVSVMLALIAGQAFAQTPSLVTFTLELGGSNNGATCDGSDQPFFTAGSPDDYQVLSKSEVTWDVKLSVTGDNMVMEGEPPAPVYYPVQGVANFVFNLKLYKDAVVPGSEIAAADFISTTNDGTDGCPSASAAFAYSFQTNALPDWTPGRAFDAYKAALGNTGGPWMEVYTYPTDAANGILLGMGAGYAQWKRESNTAFSTAGVGQEAPQAGDPVKGPQGLGPVSEGQIDMSLLADGTYILVLEPGAGINVLRGDLDLSITRPTFAVAADDAVGDQIIFEITEVLPCTITGWSTVWVHPGGYGERAIVLAPGATEGTAVVTEPRAAGDPPASESGIKMILVDFNRDVQPYHTAGQVIVSGDPGLVVTQESFRNSGTTFVIEFDGGSDQRCVTIDLANSFSLCLPPEEDTDCRVRALAGDINGTQTTDLTDMSLSKNVNGTSLPAAPQYDVNVDGSINLTDMSLVKSLNGREAQCLP